MSRYVVALIVDRGEGEDHPADWEWSALTGCRTEVVMTQPLPEPPSAKEHPDGVLGPRLSMDSEFDGGGAWLTVMPNGEVVW